MFDEAENQNLPHDPKLRAIVDAAYEHDGSIVDLVDKEGNPVKFYVFDPVLWALRGSISDVPMSMLSRAFIIAMKRGTPRKRLEKDFFKDFDFVAVRHLQPTLGGQRSTQSRSRITFRASSRSSPS